MANLQASIRESGAQIVSDGLAYGLFRRRAALQLFQNLLATPSIPQRAAAPIQVSAVRLDDSWRFAVADNGIGIEPQYA